MNLKGLQIGAATFLVDVGSNQPLVLTGTIEPEHHRHHDTPLPPPFPPKVKVEGEIVEEEKFLLVDVTGAILPPGFPLTIAQLLGDIALNLDFVVAIFPVEV